MSSIDVHVWYRPKDDVYWHLYRVDVAKQHISERAILSAAYVESVGKREALLQAFEADGGMTAHMLADMLLAPWFEEGQNEPPRICH